nr:3-beta-hydroxysteroid dehydrogenase 2 [Digitalis lanata]
MSKQRLEGKVAIVTGAASGIGEAAARLFIEHGARVVVADIQDELAQNVISSINSDKVSYFHCDVRDEKQVADTVNYATAKYGTLDIMFSNAAVLGPDISVLELDMGKLDDTFATNVRGVAATIKHAGRAMVERKVKGSIICTASVAACVGGVAPIAYTATKHAVVGLVKSACGELGAHGIRVNCVSPYLVATPLTCSAYEMEPSEVEATMCANANLKGVVLKAMHVAEVALFLASDESAYVSGQNVAVDGGFTVVKALGV